MPFFVSARDLHEIISDVNGALNGLATRLARIESDLSFLKRAARADEGRDDMIQQEIEDIKKAATENKDAADAAVTMLKTFIAKVEEAKNDKEELAAVLTTIRQSTASLIDASVSGTPTASGPGSENFSTNLG